MSWREMGTRHRPVVISGQVEKSTATCTGTARPEPERGLAQLLEELAALLFPEALDTPGVADADFLHDPACFDLAEEALENGEDLHFPNDLIALALVQEFVQRYRAHLEAVF
jgi:hypothetical protein